MTGGSLLVIVGPTATGKTALALAVAREHGGELLNADSRQVIAGLRVGTGAPSLEELGEVPCHLLGLRQPGEPFSVADWLGHAEAALESVRSRGRVPIAVGGTGLYVTALVDGLDTRVPPDRERRRRRAAAAEAQGLDVLVDELRRRDPDAAQRVDVHNPRRLIRALEILDARGAPLRRSAAAPRRPAALVGLDAPPHLHATLIEDRVRRMFGSGTLMQEVDAALDRGVDPAVLAASGIGYREALSLRAGRVSGAQAQEAVVLRTRRYARAQRTWWRRDPRVRWLERTAAPVETLAPMVAAQGGWPG